MTRSLLTNLAVAVAVLLAGCQPADRSQSGNQPVVTEDTDVVVSEPNPQQLAISARDDLQKQLSTRLIAAMSSGGPAAAIEVCSRDASGIAEKVGEQHGVSIGRTSFKLRNPSNTPPQWAQALVDDRSEEAQFVELSDGGTGALLPIKLKTQCLTCHGPLDQISADVKEELSKRYPDDQATGFQDGELRGWFWVSIPAASK